MKLTTEQKKIINHSGGHSKVMAVAGSGKTTTMIERIIHLIKNGSNPKRILVLMFNNEASKEFKIKLEKRAKEEGLLLGLPNVRTFHAMALKLCSYFENKNIIEKMKLETRDYVIKAYAKNALAEYLNNNDFDYKKTNEAIEEFCNFITLVESDITTPEQKIYDIKDRMGEDIPLDYVDCYYKFEEMRKNNKIRFFNNIIKDPVMAIFKDKSLKKFVSNIYDHIILDEYQDINEVQQRMTVFIAGERAKVMAVGDADQCIYEWRGAKPEYIVELFEDDFEDASIYTLSRTYRFGDKLSLYMNNIISNNKNRDNKICISHSRNKVTNINYYEQKYSSNVLSEEIKKSISKGEKYSDNAILLRKFSMSIYPEIKLFSQGIPYEIIGGESIFQRGELLSLEFILRIMYNNFENISTDKLTNIILSFIKSIAITSNTDAEEITSKIRFGNDDTFENNLIKTLKDKKDKIKSKRSKTKIDYVLDAIKYKVNKSYDIYHNLKIFIDVIDFKKSIEDRSQDKKTAKDKIYVIDQVLEYIKNNNNIEDILKTFNQINDSSLDKVIITSIHRSKGLEWNNVYLVGLNNDHFPGKTNNDLIEESERRLFYVGSTRAKNNLILLHEIDDDLKKGIFNSKRYKASKYLFEGNIKEVEENLSFIKSNKEIKENNLYKFYQKKINE